MNGILNISFWYLLIVTGSLMIVYTNYILDHPPGCSSPNPKISSHTQLLILATWRSGSSFVGQLFNQNPEVFYLMEPTIHVWNRLPNQSPGLLHLPMRDLLRSIFMCDMSTFQPYMSRSKYISDLFMWHDSRALCSPPACNAFQRSDIIHRPTCSKKCSNSTFDKVEEACKTYSHIVVKVVRFLDLKVLYPLLTDPQLNLKIIHLVRDPRAILLSREHFRGLGGDDRHISKDTKSIFSIYNVMQQICAAQVNIYQTAMQDPPPFLNDRYIMVRYEDLVKDPLGSVQEWYHYVGLSMSTKMESWIYNITHRSGPSEKGFLSYTKNSMKTAQHWRDKLSFQKVKSIQDVCKKAMDMFGYRIVESEEEQKDQSLHLVLPKATHLFWHGQRTP